MEKIIYTEIQRFRQWWMWAIILFVDARIVVAFLFDKLNGPEAQQELRLWELILLIAVSSLLTLMFVTMHLTTRIDEEGVHVRFIPFHFREKHIYWKDISKAYVRTYSPLWEYGGWGIKYGSAGKAYNVSGKEGLQLELTNGKKVLIGTLQPELVKEAIQAFGEGNDRSVLHNP